MLKQFLAKHFGLVELNEAEKYLIAEHYQRSLEEMKYITEQQKTRWAKHFCSRLTALGIPFTYNKRTGIK